MNRFDAYIQKQEGIIEVTTYRLEKNIEMAMRLAENAYYAGLIEWDPYRPPGEGRRSELYIGNPSSDARLRVKNSNERTKVTDFYCKAESPDPVFRKLSETRKIAYGPAASFLTCLQVMMEMRQGMNELEYDYINSVSPTRLANQLHKIHKEFGPSDADMEKGFSRMVENHYQRIRTRKTQ